MIFPQRLSAATCRFSLRSLRHLAELVQDVAELALLVLLRSAIHLWLLEMRRLASSMMPMTFRVSLSSRSESPMRFASFSPWKLFSRIWWWSGRISSSVSLLRGLPQ